MREVDICQRVRIGRNCIAVKLVVTRRTDGILDLLKIMGNFSLREAGNHYVIIQRGATINVGDWTKQGYPFYSGTGVYRAEVDVPKEYEGGAFFFEVECGEDVLEVSWNGGPGRVAPWYPYRLDVSDCVRVGKNSLEIKVTNTLINILEGVQKVSGMMASPKLHCFRRYALSVKG
jgi:hypothetical protein